MSIQIPPFRIHPSACGQIMGLVGRPTDKQLATIGELQAKPKLTDIQQATLNDLIAKRDAPPQLTEGAKTYCKQWLKEKLYARRKEFSNKYTEKGITCEPAGIELLAQYMGYGLIAKNETFYQNDWMVGTPDVVLSDIIEEIKNSWSCFTFPLFEQVIPDMDYEYQVQCYMELTGKKKAAVNYVLIDAPLEIMDAEARRVWYKAGNNGDVDMECYDEVYAKMTYPNIPMELRIKRFTYDYQPAIIETIKSRVELCREYINSIMPSQDVLDKLN